MAGTTARGAFPFPDGGDPPDTDGAIRTLAQDLALKVAIDSQGLLADRPLAGVAGRYYAVIDGPSVGQVFRDNGATWVRLGGGDADTLDGQDSSVFETKAGASAAYVARAAFASTGATAPSAFPQGVSTSLWPMDTAGAPSSIASYTVLTVAASTTSLVQYATERDATPEGDETTFYRTGSAGGTPEWGAWQRLRSSAEVTAISVSTAETTTSTAYASLATAGPDAQITVGPSGRARVVMTGEIENNTAGQTGYLSAMVVSGPSAVAPADSRALVFTSSTAGAKMQASREVIFSGLLPGNYTLRLQYRVTGGTGTFRNRQIIGEVL